MRRFFATEDDDLLGNAGSCHGGLCCLDCHRYVPPHSESLRVLIPGACGWCGRVPFLKRVVAGLDGYREH